MFMFVWFSHACHYHTDQFDSAVFYLASSFCSNHFALYCASKMPLVRQHRIATDSSYSWETNISRDIDLLDDWAVLACCQQCGAPLPTVQDQADELCIYCMFPCPPPPLPMDKEEKEKKEEEAKEKKQEKPSLEKEKKEAALEDEKKEDGNLLGKTGSELGPTADEPDFFLICSVCNTALPCFAGDMPPSGSNPICSDCIARHIQSQKKKVWNKYRPDLM